MRRLRHGKAAVLAKRTAGPAVIDLLALGKTIELPKPLVGGQRAHGDITVHHFDIHRRFRCAHERNARSPRANISDTQTQVVKKSGAGAERGPSRTHSAQHVGAGKVTWHLGKTKWALL